VPFAQNPYKISPQQQQLTQQSPNLNLQPKELSMPRYINYVADYGGCGMWRIMWPEVVINCEGLGISQSTTAMVLDPRWYQNVKAVRVQRQAGDHQKRFVEFLKTVQQQFNFKIIYEVDDVVFSEEIPDYNKFKFAFVDPSIRQNCIDIINMCDEVIVTCPFMKKLYQEKTGKQEITVLPNFPPYFWLGHYFNPKKIYDNLEKFKKRPRVLYTGSGAHYDVDNKNKGQDDFSHVLNTIIKTVDKYQWIFVGAFPPPLLPFVQSGKIEFHSWQTLFRYPRLFDSLNANITIAPLMNNNFNKSKSDIKFIESCCFGLPCLVQNMETYQNAPDFLKFVTGDELEEKLDNILNWKNRQKYYQNVFVYQKIAHERFLEHPENIGCHIDVLATPYGSPDRKYVNRFN
jgi:glycosyltransferase involved in cell wall biosynthesis